MNVLQVSTLNKYYGSVHALKNVDLSIPKGSVYGILGPNGSGKTTMLAIITNVLNATSGAYKWFEKENHDEQRKKIGALIETPNFYPYLNGVDNLKITQLISERGKAADIEVILKRFDLWDKNHIKFGNYSLGMKQRLAVASATLGNPEVLILDEPTNGLDPEGIAFMRKIIRELADEGKTIIMASHLLEEVEKVCSHVAILQYGNLLAQGTVQEILGKGYKIKLEGENLVNIREKIQQRFPSIQKITTDKNILILNLESEIKTAELNKFCFENNVSLSLIEIIKTNLEDKFFEITKS